MTEVPNGPQALLRLEDAVRRLAVQTHGRALTGRAHDDADDTVGTVATDSAVGFDPLPLLRALDACGARVVVMGQVAGIMHGSQELTGDLDLLWDGDLGYAEALARGFASLTAQLTDDAGASLPCDGRAFHLPKIQFRSLQASGDCCTPALQWGDLAIEAFIDRSLEVRGRDGFTVRYLRREDLVRMRRAVGRAKDLRRAEELERF